jgi:hypothetical protein
MVIVLREVALTSHHHHCRIDRATEMVVDK